MSVLGLWLGRTIGSWFGPVAQEAEQEATAEGTRGGRGSRGLLEFSADDLRALDELHDARRAGLEQAGPVPAQVGTERDRPIGPVPGGQDVALDVVARGLVVDPAIQGGSAPEPVAQAADAPKRALAKKVSVKPSASAEEEEFIAVLMQVLLAA